jgi:hypothetical protein
MLARLSKIAAVMVIGLALVSQGLALSTAPISAAQQAAVTCCATGCSKCGSTSCCAASSENRAPAAPATERGASQELQALAVTFPKLLTLDAPPLHNFSTPAASAALTDGTVPIFQRNCSFLI